MTHSTSSRPATPLLCVVVVFVWLLAFGGSMARADLVSIEYRDRGTANPSTNGGPLWTGVVDTVTNNLRIDTWSELPQHGAEFWVPVDLPLIWPALDAAGNVFDVPDNFGSVVGGTVNISSAFGFISPDFAHNMQWEDINGNPQTFSSTLFLPTQPGWGGYAQLTEQGYFINTEAPSGEPDYDEQTMPRLPVDTAAMVASLDATVVVTAREVTSAGVIVAIPESASLLRFAIVGAMVALGGCLKFLRRRVTTSKTSP